MNIENNYNKVYIAKNCIKNACNDVFNFFNDVLVDTINYWILDKKYTFFRIFIFAWII